MKKRFLTPLILGFVIQTAAVLAPTPSVAKSVDQGKPTRISMWAPSSRESASDSGQELLIKVSSTYKALKTIEAGFVFEFFRGPDDQIGQTDEGKLWMDQQARKYRISTSEQELISDGKTQWAVLKDADEVQITDAGQDEGSITPLNVFSFFNSGYTVKNLGSEKAGTVNLNVLELIPTDKRQNYSKIEMRINKADTHIYDLTVFDKNNSRYRYTIKNFKANTSIPGERFVFNSAVYPGMEIVDLR